MSKKKSTDSVASISAVRPTHDKLGGHTQGMTVGRNATITVTYSLDVLGRDLFTDREGAIEMYAQMAASRIREILSPIRVTS